MTNRELAAHCRAAADLKSRGEDNADKHLLILAAAALEATEPEPLMFKGIAVPFDADVRVPHAPTAVPDATGDDTPHDPPALLPIARDALDDVIGEPV